MYRIEKTNKRYDRIYFTCKKCGKKYNVLLRVKLEEFEFMCRACKTITKFGGPSPFSSKLVRDKAKSTLMKNYDVENPGQSEVIKNKIKQTNLNV